MVQSLKTEQQSEKPDPNMLQRMASNPLESIWVGASAGTGKTKVLTDRVLRLLLPRDNELPGTPPHKILCLTYTKAAANEMALRIGQILGKWAVLEISELQKQLESLLGYNPKNVQITAAQRLFAEVIESAGSLQIMTIHSFCQSVLGRFPLEADLPPNFVLMDDLQSAELLKQAQKQVLEHVQSQAYKMSPQGAALHAVAAEVDEKSFFNLMCEISREKGQMKALFRHHTAEQIYARICTYYDIPQNVEVYEIRKALCADEAFDKAGLKETAECMLQEGGKTSTENGAWILKWVEDEPEKRLGLLAAHHKVFLTTEGEPRTGHFPVKGVVQAFPRSIDILRAESQRLIEAQERLNRMKSASLTRDLLYLGHEILNVYQDLKRQKGALDFDDLILRTTELLRGDTAMLEGYEKIAPWIMYKLDQGIDHILVDEAQDTNADQWKIVEALCEEFFHGLSARDSILRTSFTVGDVKQSIYSFQRAAPEEFQRMQNVFDAKVKNAGQIHKNIDLEISFRSTRSVLRAVDRVFAQEALNKAVGGGDIRHISYRQGQAGRVELWPLFESPKKEKIDFWTPPTVLKSQTSGSAQLAAHIAEKISSWLGREILPSADRPIAAGDIMILVRTRSAFVDQLVRALKQKSIPVSGVDRMMLGEQLAVQDLLALARFATLPEDDLNLACVLKSPFLGWNEEELFSLAYKRSKSLWQELQHFDPHKGSQSPAFPVVSGEKREKTLEFLMNLLGLAQNAGAYEFFSKILYRPCPADTISGLRAVRSRLGEDALDPVDELLNAALAFGSDHIDTLQTFIAHQEENDIEIKRELEESGGVVRIMTIHGSKGLQAPIVIMPDTMMSSAAKKMSRILWPNKTGLDFPLWSPRGEDDPAAFERLYEAGSQKAQNEYYRLLYVAMTRAADRLYVAGYRPTRGEDEKSWYFMIQNALKDDPQIQNLEEGILRLENLQIDNADQKKPVSQQEKEHVSAPEWMFTPASEEQPALRPLIPSRLALQDQPQSALSPLAGGQNYRFRRGVVTHKLLQFLPSFDPEKRKIAAEHFLLKNAQDLPDDVRTGVVTEVMDILNHPEYKAFFRKGSMAEVPITGITQDNRIISGQIDRLVIGAEDIWILDYKTNRPPPLDIKDVPQVYRNQLSAYRDTLAQIYPQHKIHCALLWTDGPRLMIIE